MQLDTDGRAVIMLPDYFESINKNASYQLTAIGSPMPNLYIDKEISNQRFSIAGGVAAMKVSWVVTAERNDPYLQQNPQKRMNVIDKGERRGKYFNPKAHNQPEEKSMIYKNLTEKRKVVSDEQIKATEKDFPRQEE